VPLPSLAVRRSRTLLPGLTTALVAAAFALTAAPALAHSELLESTPAAGDTLTAAPQQVQLVFGENVQEQGGAIVVETAEGARVDQVKTFATDANVATVQLAKNAPAGKYTVSFRVVSADGHIVTDSFSYQVTPTSTAGPASSAAATTSAAAAGTDSSPAAGTNDADTGSGASVVWVLGLGAIGVVLVAAVIAVVVRGRRERSD
jgi:methionine-rich copper-binding protein CopC